MYLTVKQQLKNLPKEDYNNLMELSHVAKNLYNFATYNVRQYYFQEKEYLKYEQNNVLCKSNENYKMLNSNMAQQILKEVDGALNILRKSSVVDLSVLYSSGEVATPVRIRIT